ncbi:adenylate/guanylate cyclase catalytic domain protein, partial [Cooperia oncophora]
LQIVNLLNDLYNGFDSIIEEHSVYKVESIGDGYLCVSGLPVRNGYAHIKEIAELSLSFMKFVEEFRISALPKERVQLRIGVNSGTFCNMLKRDVFVNNSDSISQKGFWRNEAAAPYEVICTLSGRLLTGGSHKDASSHARRS